MNYASRMGRLGTETAFEVLARAQALEAQGKSVVHLEFCDPDFGKLHSFPEGAIEDL